jgi:hypothetical protein
MAITTYGQLVSAVTEWLARDQDTTLVLRIPDFITLAEAKLNRELFVPQMEKRSTTTVDTTSDEPEFISLPTDFQSMISLRLSNVTGKPPLRFLGAAQVDSLRYRSNNVTAQPAAYTIIGSEIELIPTPGQDYTIEMVYRAIITPLNVDNTSNWLLLQAPDVYLYGTLLETAPYLKEDSRIQTWLLGFKSAIDGLNRMRARQSWDAAPAGVSLPGCTP